ncbi:hypothetical protein RJG79_04695 [Mycoplasmatota bacterium WC44]
MNQIVDNWDNGRWSFNRFCTHNNEEATGNRICENGVQIWEDDGVIVGVCHYEEPGDYFLQFHPKISDHLFFYNMYLKIRSAIITT